jgi:hypothetical protein
MVLTAVVATLAPVASLAHSTKAASNLELALVQNVLDSAGFHQIAERLAQTKAVAPGDQATVSRVRKVIAQVVWPEKLQAQGSQFLSLLDKFNAALASGKADDLVSSSDAVHDAQHALSHAIDGLIAPPKE